MSKYILPDSTLHTKTYMPTIVRAAIRINSTKNTGQSFLFMIQLRTLKEKSAGNKLPSMKALYAEKDRLIELRDTHREDFSNRRDYERELRTVSANIDIILGKSHEEEQQIEKKQNL